MLKILLRLIVLGILAATASKRAAAQNPERKYVAGIRSALIVGSMNLSGLDPAFDDLKPDGVKGAHMSGFFLMYKVRPYLRLGVETLVANADQTAATTMNYQAAGPVIEFSYGKTVFISGGLHAGGLVVNAMARAGAAPAEGATSGSFFKGEGYFLAPYADVGYRYRRGEVGLFLKRVNVSGESERGGLSAFGSSFVGLRFALAL